MITKAASSMLEKVAIARWKAEWSGLSNKAKGTLINNDVTKPWREELAGINKGTDNIIKRYGGQRISAAPSMDIKYGDHTFRAGDILEHGGGYVTIPSAPGKGADTIISANTPSASNGSIITSLPKSRDGLGVEQYNIRDLLASDAIGRRHEAYELVAAKKTAPKDKMITRRINQAMSDEELDLFQRLAKNDPTIDFFDPEIERLMRDSAKKTVNSQHVHPQVIVKELRDINRSPALSIGTRDGIQRVRSSLGAQYVDDLDTFIPGMGGGTGEGRALFQAMTGRENISYDPVEIFKALYGSKLTNKDYRAMMRGFIPISDVVEDPDNTATLIQHIMPRIKE